MLERYAFGFHEVLVRIGRSQYQAHLAASSTYSSRHKADEYSIGELASNLTAIRAECDKLRLTPTSELISHVESEIQRKGDGYTNGDLDNHLNTLVVSFANDLRRKKCFFIAPEKEKFFETDSLGPKASKAFASCVEEIRNAGNCYALEQNEACVFHMMRVLERGLNALAGRFNVSFANDNWHNVIEQTEAEIRKMNAANSGPDWKEKQKFYAAAAAQFMFVKEAWRNHVMHLRDVYDEGRALSIFTHVREVMHALADGGLADHL